MVVLLHAASHGVVVDLGHVTAPPRPIANELALMNHQAQLQHEHRTAFAARHKPTSDRMLLPSAAGGHCRQAAAINVSIKVRSSLAVPFGTAARHSICDHRLHSSFNGACAVPLVS
jgi:hypothetical protein